MKRHILLTALLTFFIICNAIAQSKPLRVEIEPKSKSDDYYIAPAGSHGLVVFNETKEKSDIKGERVWSFSLYDPMFKEVWTKTSSAPKDIQFVKFYNDKNSLYILLADKKGGYDGSNATYMGNFSIINVEMPSGKMALANGKLPYNTTINDFKVVNNTAFFGGKKMPTSGQVFGKQCLLYATCCIPVAFGGLEFKTPGTISQVDLKSNRQNYTEIELKGNSNVTSIDLEGNDMNSNIFVANRESKTKVNGYIFEFNKEGKHTGVITLEPGENEINTGTITSLGEKQKLIIGTYSLPVKANSFAVKMQRALAPTSVGYSQGIYLAKVQGEKQEYIKYYSFSDLKNFFGYLPTRSEEKIEKASRRKKEKGKDLKLNYNVLVHPVIEQNGKFYFVGECYYPEYHTEYYTTYVNGKPTTQTRRVFDGWRYTHAIVVAFDKAGNLLWDASFPIYNILTFNLKERVKILPQGNTTVLVYSYSGFLTSKVITANGLSDGNISTPIDTGYEGDKVKTNYSSDIIHWYDNYFIAWGYQKIKNKEDDDVKKKRNVFYFNKIAFK